MRFITRKEFKAIKEQTLFAKYEDQCFYGFGVKVSNTGNNDWIYASLDAGSIEEYDSKDRLDKLTVQEENATSGKVLNIPMDFECTMRDGHFEKDDSLIAIYDEADILALVERLTELLPNHLLVTRESLR